VLKELMCAAARLQSVPFLCQRSLTLFNTCLHSRARSLRDTSLGPQEAAALAEGLKGNSTLQVLK